MYSWTLATSARQACKFWVIAWLHQLGRHIVCMVFCSLVCTIRPWTDTCWHFIFDLLHLSLGQQLYVMSPAQLTHWTNLGTNLDNKCNCPIGPNRRSISLGNLWAKCTAQLPSLNLVNTCEYHAALQFSSRRSICRLYFCAKSHKLGINPWQGPRLHSLLTVFAPLHCTRWWKPKRRNPRLRVDVRNL